MKEAVLKLVALPLVVLVFMFPSLAALKVIGLIVLAWVLVLSLGSFLGHWGGGEGHD